MMAEKTKVYGLILPKEKSEQTKPPPAAFSVFGNDSDEEEKPPIHGSIFGPNTGSSKIKRQTQIDIDKALLEDPNIYEYDAIYDEMQASKPKVGAKEKDKNNVDKKPKYIMGLLKAAEKKKKEEERRKERKVQKEREDEGDMFADKEKFVTSAYKQKMLEMQEEEEKERREAAFEAMTDVTKQKDMSGFYRYLYRETTGNADETRNQKQEETGNAEVTVEPDESPEQRPQPQARTALSSSEPASSGNDSETEGVKTKKKDGFRPSQPSTSNKYRKRKAESSDSYDSTEETKGRRKRSVSRSPHRIKGKRSSHTQGSVHRRSKSRSSSPVFDRRKRERSVSRERIKKGDISRDERAKKDHISRDGSRRNKLHRSRSREKSRRSRSTSREKLRRSLSRSRGRSKRSRSKDRSQKGKSPRSNAERAESSKSESVDRRNINNPSRSPSSEYDSGKVGLRQKSTTEIKKSQRTGKAEGKEKHKNIEMSQDEECETDNVARFSGKDKTVTKVDAAREQTDESANITSAKVLAVDPVKKVYPYHNSPSDIEEAKKRYLQRKTARQGVVG